MTRSTQRSVPDVSPHAQEVLLQKRFDLAPTGHLVTVRKVTAIVALQDGSGLRTRLAIYLLE